MPDKHFQKALKDELAKYLAGQKNRFDREDTLKIDLHCHDCNSDVPDELIGRILRVPETWLPGERLMEELKINRCNAFTVTNHNNARSCYALQDKGFDVLTAAEFSCFAPDFEIGIHVLAYGFTPEQEVRLEKSRKNLYAFLHYARQYDIPVIWAHPLYHYSVKKTIPQDFFNKMLLLFERFETLNGQRDTWQNMLVKEWIGSVTEDTINGYARKYGINLSEYCADPYRKVLTGGSDSHMGIFAGLTGSYLYVPGLKERLRTESSSALALEAIRKGDIAPYGSHQNAEKLTIAFLNYVCQIALNYKDPGLVRLLLHQGEISDKIISLLASNVFGEVRNHKVTMSFIRLFYDCLMGKSPSSLKRFFLSPAYKPVFDLAANMANERKSAENNFVGKYYNSILSINSELNKILSERISEKLKKRKTAENRNAQSLEAIISELELPSFIRSYLDGGKEKKPVNLSAFLDGLSFPFFASLFILAAHFTAAKSLFNARPFLRRFSGQLGKFEQPGRVLWLTDTFCDRNGVSMFLQEMHRHIKTRNLPIDIMVCSNKIRADEHLVVLKPIGEFSLPACGDRIFSIPNFVELHNLFIEGEYDRIICSTEGIMALCGLYLKHAYTVEASFYMHADRLMYAREALNITGHNLDRIRRMLRFFYRSFDKILVLDSGRQQWLTGRQMNLAPEKVFRTAHWANECFVPHEAGKAKYFGIAGNSPVLLYVGRINNEKGVLELPFIYANVKQTCNNVRLVIVGRGAAAEQLRAEIPDAVFTDWIPQKELPYIYSSADILLLPSRFDTFCHVAIEALSCGLPVIAYNSKSAKDMIVDNDCGFLVKSRDEMSDRIIDYLQRQPHDKFKAAAIERSKEYSADRIVNDLMYSIGMTDRKRSVPLNG
ncbi:MAG: glycosyltransferase [Tannerella sp.]|jgi:glycosyltransferase involved in cell wall biosynthesis|nr:glycosyltransferase [Tannerella sp.]